MSDICADIAVSENSVRRFVSELGSKQDRLDAFMRDQVMPGSTLLFDGTSIFIIKNIYCVDTGDKQGFKVSAIQTSLYLRYQRKRRQQNVRSYTGRHDRCAIRI